MRTHLVDLHMHTDYDGERLRWHGERPEVLARHIAGSNLDMAVITNHHAASPHFFDVRAEVARNVDGTGREVKVLLGSEMTVMFDHHPYHVLYAFEEDFAVGDLPTMPPHRCAIRELDEYVHDYPGVRVLAHPPARDRLPTDSERTRDLLTSGYVDGAEVLNGSVLVNGNGKGIGYTETAARLFLEARGRIPRLAAVGSSDAHKGPMVGVTATAFEGDGHLDFFAAVKAGTTRAHANRADVRDRLAGVLCNVPEIRPFIGGCDAA